MGKKVWVFFLLGLWLGLSVWAKSEIFITVGKGGDRIEIEGSGSHEVWIKISGGKVRLEQFMISPLRSKRGDVRDLLRCWVRFQGASTGRIDWVSGELVSRSPKTVFVSSGLEGSETRLILKYKLDASSCYGSYTGVLGLIAYSEDDPGNKKIVSIPVKVKCASSVKIEKVSTGKELLLESDKIAYVEVSGKGNITLRKRKDSPQLEVRLVKGDKKGDWLSFDRSLELAIAGKTRIEFRLKEEARAGDWRGTLYLITEGRRFDLPIEVKIRPKVDWTIEKIDVNLKIPRKGKESNVGEIVISIRSNIPEKVSLVQEFLSRALMSSKGGSIPLNYLFYSVQEKQGQDWITILPWRKVEPRAEIFRMKKNKFQTKIRILYRLRVRDVVEVPPGDYRLPVRFSVVMD